MSKVQTKNRTFLGSGLVGGITGAVTTGVLLYVCAVLIQKGSVLNYDLVEEAVISCAFMGAVLGGIISAHRQGRGVLAAGLTAGAADLLLLMLLPPIIVGTPVFSVMTIKLLICCFAGSVCGGVICMGKKHKNTKYRQRRLY